MYQHVVSNAQGSFTARALVGTRSIMLAWDHVGPAAERDDLLGFAIHRFDLTVPDDDWLQGQKRFAFQQHLGDNLPSNVAPFQRFRWGDYGAYPGHSYRYEIHPVRGTPTNPQPQAPITLSLESAAHLDGSIGVYSNRGVSASLAYNVKFGKPPQDLPEPKRTQAYDWLTRDIKPALLSFIGAAGAGDELRVCIYEFEDDEIRAAFLAAIGRGVKVRVVYHARPDDAQSAVNATNLGPLAAVGAEVIARTAVEKISHNKFIVHLVGGAPGAAPTPRRVWTGSTNFTRAGLYLQTNLGLVFESTDVASGFARYWELLRSNPDKTAVKGPVGALVTSVRSTLPNGPTVYLSPVAGKELLDTAIDLVSHANQLVVISSPFGLDVKIRTAINGNDPDIVEYGLVNTSSGVMVKQLPHALNKFSWFTTPAWLPTFDGRPWDNQPFGQHKIHTKSIVADPFSQSPRLLVGSANFSDESVNKNDENAFLIDGDGRASAIVATEFLRMFDHYKTRKFLADLQQTPDDEFLAEDGSWSKPYYEPFRLKFRERQVFGGN
jgi:phosphatidylserine/phosphatidylglycerophosphate/cardiolipin synthase-like enzyme